MTPRTRSTLAALVGAAVVSTAVGHGAACDTTPTCSDRLCASQAADEDSGEPSTPQRLGDVIASRLQRAQQTGKHTDIERLATLWMTLRARGQLDRMVTRGDRFVSVALRNQQRSELRAAKRVSRCVPTDAPTLAALAGARGSMWQACTGTEQPDERLDATELLDSLEEPLRTAVTLSATGLNRREVAEQMGVSHDAVRKWMQRLRTRLGPTPERSEA